MVDIVSLQKMVLYWIHLRSINMSSALIFHLQKTFPMSIFDFQVHLCADGSPPNMLPHNCKTHTLLPLNPAFTRARPPLGIRVFRSCKGPPGDPNKRSFNVPGKAMLFLSGSWFVSMKFFPTLLQKNFFFGILAFLSLCPHDASLVMSACTIDFLNDYSPPFKKRSGNLHMSLVPQKV